MSKRTALFLLVCSLTTVALPRKSRAFETTCTWIAVPQVPVITGTVEGFPYGSDWELDFHFEYDDKDKCQYPDGSGWLSRDNLKNLEYTAEIHQTGGNFVSPPGPDLDVIDDLVHFVLGVTDATTSADCKILAMDDQYVWANDAPKDSPVVTWTHP